MMKSLSFFKGTIVAAALALIMVLPAAPVSAQQPAGSRPGFPIAVVDVGRVFRDSKTGQAIDAKLRAEGQALEKKMADKDAELKKSYEALIKEAQGGKTTREALEKKEKDLQQKIQAFQTERATEMEKMNRNAEDALKPLQTKTETVINTLAATKKYVLVLNSAGVVYAPGSVDITAEVISEIDKGL